MLPKHYKGLKMAFPDLTDDECEELFSEGFATPKDVKAATKQEIATATTSRVADKVKGSKKPKAPEDPVEEGSSEGG